LQCEVSANNDEAFGAAWVIPSQFNIPDIIASDFYSIVTSLDENSSNKLTVRTKVIPEQYRSSTQKLLTKIKVYAFDKAYAGYFNTKSNGKSVEDAFVHGGNNIGWNLEGENAIGLFIGIAKSPFGSTFIKIEFMKKLILNILLILFIALNGCLKDAPIVQATSEQNNSADILIYLESQGDFINSQSMPSLITSVEVFNNPSDKIILDVRSASEFASGHIQNAINILPSDLFNYVKTQDPNKTIVIVSLSGQSASYYAGLLRLAGFSNIFALKFGIASWNMNFANIWINANQSITTTHFTNLAFDKPNISALPDITFTNAEGNIKEKINSRIQELMSDTFLEDNISEVSISVGDLINIHSPSRGDFLNTFYCFVMHKTWVNTCLVH